MSTATAPEVKTSYEDFLQGKFQRARPVGFAAQDLNPHLKPFQADITQWACHRGRAALWEECGLGKTIQQLEWIRQVWERDHDKAGLLLTPLAVAPQTLREAHKFDIACPVQIIREQSESKPGINLCNYDRLHLLDPSAFPIVCLDESGILKSYTGATKRALCEGFRNTPFRLACTATPAPNDRMELGNHSDFLGIMPSDEMLARWFINDSMKSGGYILRPFAKDDFWRWCASWAVCISRPSDIGHDDADYILPPLNIIEHVIESRNADPGCLFALGGKISATTVHQEKRRVLADRVGIVSDIVHGTDGADKAWVVWCDTDYEADALVKAIPDAVEVRGSQPTHIKEERLEAFGSGKVRVIVTKARIAGHGLNWQRCHRTIWFAGYSFEAFYQAIRRLWRFGQTEPVDCHIVMSDQEESIKKVLDRKAQNHMELQCEMASLMQAGMLEELYQHRELKRVHGTQTVTVPEWLRSKRSQVARSRAGVD